MSSFLSIYLASDYIHLALLLRTLFSYFVIFKLRRQDFGNSKLLAIGHLRLRKYGLLPLNNQLRLKIKNM